MTHKSTYEMHGSFEKPTKSAVRQTLVWLVLAVAPFALAAVYERASGVRVRKSLEYLACLWFCFLVAVSVLAATKR